MFRRTIRTAMILTLACVGACESKPTVLEYNIGQKHFRDGVSDLSIVDRVEMEYTQNTSAATITVLFKPFHDSMGKLIEDRWVRWNIDSREAEIIRASQQIKVARDDQESKIFSVAIANAPSR